MDIINLEYYKYNVIFINVLPIFYMIIVIKIYIIYGITKIKENITYSLHFIYDCKYVYQT